MEDYLMGFTKDKARSLEIRLFDPAALAAKLPPHERWDQKVFDVLMSAG